jgi:hypothetical protein
MYRPERLSASFRSLFFGQPKYPPSRAPDLIQRNPLRRSRFFLSRFFGRRIRKGRG